MKRNKNRFGRDYKKEIKENKAAFVVFIILRLLVVAAMIISCISGNYENLFYCVLTLVLFAIPSFVENNFGIELPGALEVVILLFIFAAEILGEMGSYYTKVPYWDLMLHTVNGFLCAAIGFALIDILNRNERIKFKLSPVFLAIVAFCFSMTIGVLWEFFEFACDTFFGTDMQKDSVVTSVVSTYLSGSTKNPVVIENIKMVIVDGKALGIDGYLDIGLMDTIEDLFVNFIGAAVFSVIGYFYVKSRGRGKIASQFIPHLKNDEETSTESVVENTEGVTDKTEEEGENEKTV